MEQFLKSDDFWQGIVVETFGVAIELAIVLAIIPIIFKIREYRLKSVFLPLSCMIVAKNYQDMIQMTMSLLNIQQYSFWNEGEVVSHRIYGFLYKEIDDVLDYLNNHSEKYMRVNQKDGERFFDLIEEKISDLNQNNFKVQPLDKWPYHLLNLQAVFIVLKSSVIIDEDKKEVAFHIPTLLLFVMFIKTQFEELKKPLDYMDSLHRYDLKRHSALQRWAQLRRLKKMGLLDMFKMKDSIS